MIKATQRLKQSSFLALKKAGKLLLINSESKESPSLGGTIREDTYQAILFGVLRTITFKDHWFYEEPRISIS